MMKSAFTPMDSSYRCISYITSFKYGLLSISGICITAFTWKTTCLSPTYLLLFVMSNTLTCLWYGILYCPFSFYHKTAGGMSINAVPYTLTLIRLMECLNINTYNNMIIQAYIAISFSLYITYILVFITLSVYTICCSNSSRSQRLIDIV